MKKRNVYGLSLFAVMCAATSANGQVTSASSLATVNKVTDNTVSFNVTDEGVQLPIIWGLDTAWPSDANMERGIAFIGAENLGTARASFQPSDLIVDGELSAAQKSALDNRLRLIALGGVKQIALNCDHEVMNADNYYGKPEEWAKLIEASVRYCQQKGFTVVSVAPFNEPDYTAWGEGSLEDFYNIAKLLKANSLFDNIRICGGNTLNCDQALTWYNGLKEYLDEGNTHQLAGSFDTYANFFSTVRADGKHATADELHNVMEAMVGVEYGMQTGIWWGFDGRARGEFCRASNNGDRLAYAEDRTHWSSAAVYRNNQENKVQAFIGTSERQANNSSYRFISTDRDVYFGGYGPLREFVVDMPGGTGYQVGQTNAEYVVDVDWGEDVPPYINGNYVIQNAGTGNRVLSLPLATTSEGSGIVQKKHIQKAVYQQWSVTPVDTRIGGDFSYYSILSLGNGGYSLDVLNCSNAVGASIIAYRSNNGAQQQWFLKYAGDGYFYIVSRQSNLCLQAANGESGSVTQRAIDGNARQKWRFIPAGLTSELEAPAAPSGLTATPQSASILLNWEANTESDLAGYTVLRAERPETVGADTLFNTIARNIEGTAFLDNSAVQGVGYIYKVKAVDKVGNLSVASDCVDAQTSGERGMIAQYQWDDTLSDATVNRLDAQFYGTLIYTGGVYKSGTKSVMLNASTQYFQLPYQIANMREMTVCTWIRWRDKSNAWQRIFDFGNGTDQYMFLTPSNGSEMRFVMKNKGDEEILSAEPLTPNTWVHVAVTISDEAVVLYLDGEEVARSTSMTIRPSDIHPVMNYVGRSQFNGDPFLKAYIDDFRVYNYALSADELKGVMEDLVNSVHEIETEADAQVVAIEYYTVSGVRLDAPATGLNIVKTRFSDGRVEVAKMWNK